MANNKAITEAIINIVGKLDPSVSRAIGDATKKFSGLKLAAAATGAAIAGVATATIAFGKKACDNAAEFETGMANVATLLAGTETEVKTRVNALGNDVLSISDKTGVATDDLSDGLYQIVSALGDSSDAIKQMETAAKAAKAGNATTVDSINLLSAVTKGYGDTSGAAWDKVSDLAFQTVVLGQTSFPELAASMGKVVPIASALGVTQEELFGSFATLTGVTGSTAEVSTQLKSVLAGMMTPSKNMAEAMSNLGYQSADVMLKEHGLIGTMDLLKSAVGGDEMAFSKLFTSVEAQTAVLAIAGGQADNFKTKIAAMGEVAGATQKAFERQTDTVEAMQAKIKNMLDNFTTRVGQKLLPIVKKVLENVLPRIEEGLGKLQPVLEAVYTALKPVIDGVGNLLPGVLDVFTKGIESTFSVLKALAPAVQAAFGVVKGILDKLIPVWKSAMDSMTKIYLSIAPMISEVFTEIAPVLEDIANTIGEVFVMVQPLIADVMSTIATLMTNLAPTIKGFISLVLETVKSLLPTIQSVIQTVVQIIQAAMPIIQSIFQKVSDLLAAILPFISSVVNAIMPMVDPVIQAILAAVQAILPVVQTVVGIITEIITVSMPILSNLILPVVTGIVNGIGAGINMVVQVTQGLIDFIKNVFTGNWTAAWTSVKDIFYNIFQGLAGMVKAPLNAVIGIVNKVISSINGVGFTIPDWVPLVGGKKFGLNIPAIPQFQTGGIVPGSSYSGDNVLARVNSGEMILNAEQQRSLFDFANAGSEKAKAVTDFVSGGGSSTSNSYSQAGANLTVKFSPTININGNTSNAKNIADEVMKVFDDYAPELADKIKSILTAQTEGAYGASW